MTQSELPDYKALAEEIRKRYHHRMIRAFIAAVVSAILTVFAVYVVVSSSMSPFDAFLFWIFGVGFSILLTIHTIFQAGCQSVHKYYGPKIAQYQCEYQKLSKEFEEYIGERMRDNYYLVDEYLYLATLVEVRSPELFAEFAAWREKYLQQAEQKNKE